MPSFRSAISPSVIAKHLIYSICYISRLVIPITPSPKEIKKERQKNKKVEKEGKLYDPPMFDVTSSSIKIRSSQAEYRSKVVLGKLAREAIEETRSIQSARNAEAGLAARPNPGDESRPSSSWAAWGLK